MRYGEQCPTCNGTNTNHSGYGREGQEQRYCDDCQGFYQVFAFEEEEPEPECEGHPCDDYAGDHPHAAIGDVFYCDGSCAA